MKSICHQIVDNAYAFARKKYLALITNISFQKSTVQLSWLDSLRAHWWLLCTSRVTSRVHQVHVQGTEVFLGICLLQFLALSMRWWFTFRGTITYLGQNFIYAKMNQRHTMILSFYILLSSYSVQYQFISFHGLMAFNVWIWLNFLKTTIHTIAESECKTILTQDAQVFFLY